MNFRDHKKHRDPDKYTLNSKWDNMKKLNLDGISESNSESQFKATSKRKRGYNSKFNLQSNRDDYSDSTNLDDDY